MITDANWKKIGLYPHHGIALPLFSLKTRKSCGIGEFLDLLPFIDWCKNLGFDTIQLLPLNDTGYDPSPYNPVSSCALDPIYLSLADLPDAGEISIETFAPFNPLPRLAITELKREKMKTLFAYYTYAFPAISKTDAYQRFLSEHPWLPSYCLFKALKDEYGGKLWQEWPLEYQTPRASDLAAKKTSTDFHAFLQYLCFSQMEKVHAYASSQNIFLKGDVPILLSPDSADVWAEPHLFNHDFCAGAPPDYYNPLGQKWGFPLFNWDAIRKTGFAWWKQRLHTLEKIYHLYRIDHVVGFFRIWAIPKDKRAIEGHFEPPDTSLWPAQGREILSMMTRASPLLPLAEDLGTVPKEVRPILHELGICCTNVLRWQKQGAHYLPSSSYDPFSLTTVSTPDTDTLRGWWKKFPDAAIPFAHQQGWSYQPDLTSEQLFAILHSAHHTPSYFHINLLQEYLALFPELVSPNPDEERINLPGTLLPTNWTYRFRPSLEELFAHQPLAAAIREILHA